MIFETYHHTTKFFTVNLLEIEMKKKTPKKQRYL